MSNKPRSIEEKIDEVILKMCQSYLGEKLEKSTDLNSFSEVDLEKFFSKIEEKFNIRISKDILKKEIYSKKQSPGIGLIRIAKVVRNKFEYTFQKIDNKFLYYTLDILINTK